MSEETKGQKILREHNSLMAHVTMVIEDGFCRQRSPRDIADEVVRWCLQVAEPPEGEKYKR